MNCVPIVRGLGNRGQFLSGSFGTVAEIKRERERTREEGENISFHIF